MRHTVSICSRQRETRSGVAHAVYEDISTKKVTALILENEVECLTITKLN